MRGWLVLLVGCGRVAFDPTAMDARPDGVPAKICAMPVGHDEDADGVDDACDGCPHLPDADQIDSDGDAVDDMCDPQPQLATERIAYFDPFLVEDPSWTSWSSRASLDGESIVGDTRGGTNIVLQRPLAAGVATYIVGGTFGEGTSSRRQLLIGPRNLGGTNHYYCELEGIPPNGKFSETYTFDGNNFTVAGKSNGPPPGNGDFMLAIEDRYPQVTCRTSWAVPDQEISGTLPAGLVSDDLVIAVQELVISFHYFLEIDSQ